MSHPVTYRSEFTYPERPLTIFWEGKWLAVQVIFQRWRLPTGICFWVRAEDGRSYELHYWEVNDEWQIHPL